MLFDLAVRSTLIVDMSVIGFGAAFEHSNDGLIVSAIYPGGPIHLANEQCPGNPVELEVGLYVTWLSHGIPCEPCVPMLTSIES